jgi:hypothetical protein
MRVEGCPGIVFITAYPEEADDGQPWLRFLDLY